MVELMKADGVDPLKLDSELRELGVTLSMRSSVGSPNSSEREAAASSALPTGGHE